nr:hypothetical protein Iba_chr12cCG22870 [Ipomoea batatas]GMD73612.1 hypothetical protein Iba_chr12fCG20060 [Ipomoea batatas]
MSGYALRVQRKGHQQEKKPGKSMVVFYGILLRVKLMLISWFKTLYLKFCSPLLWFRNLHVLQKLALESLET